MRGLARNHESRFTEMMDFGMPCYRGPRGVGFAFCSQVQYVALYVGPDTVSAYRSRLAGLDCGKSCVRFRRIEAIDWELVEDLIHFVAS